MLPSFYQTCLQAHLTTAQYLTLQLLIILLQTERNVKLERLAALFPQPIQFQSRRRNLQRFLALPQLSVKLLWFPLVKYLVREQFQPQEMNRKKRRYLRKIKQQGYLLLVIDRTQWQERNIMMVSLVCGGRALPVYWHLLGKKGNSNLGQQKALLSPVIKLLKPHPVIVIGDREYHSVKLAEWLTHKGVNFALRQKRSTHIKENGQDYQALKNLDLKPGMAQFFEGINCTQKHQLGGFNIALRWRRKYRGKGPREPWYILTSLNSLSLTLFCYRARWGIEAMFKDCKTGGYNLEQTKVNDTRFMALVLLIAIAYSLATFLGQTLKYKGVRQYICRLKELKRSSERHSDFWIGLYGKIWPLSDGNLVRFSPQSHGSKTPKTLLLLGRNESCFLDPVYGLALLSPREANKRKIGCYLIRHGGKHDIYHNPNNGQTEPIPRHREINERLAKKIIKSLTQEN